jgi:hypothetical protein
MKKAQQKKDVLQPEAGLLIKLGSALIHAEEFLSPDGHPLDKNTFDSLMQQPDVREWIDGMNELAFLPRKRSSDGK